MSTISASTTSTTAYKVTADTTGTLVLQTGSTPTTAVTIDTSQNVGIGVTPSAWNTGSKAIQIGAQGAIEYRGNATSIAMNAYYDSVGWKYIASNAAALYYQYLNSHVWSIAPSGTAGNAITFTEAMKLDASGNLGIGTTSPSYRLTAAGASTAGSVTALAIENPSTNAASEVRQEFRAGGTTWAYLTSSYNSNSPYLAFGVNSAERARIASDGNFLIGTNSSEAKLTVAGNIRMPWGANRSLTIGTSSNWGYIFSGESNELYLRDLDANFNFLHASYNSGTKFIEFAGNTLRVYSGSAQVNGSLSKSSGSFRIDHPIPEMSDTHHLVHSFVEAPQADNIYRGKATLVGGAATVNIDEVAGMTDGTFVLLNREVQCFTTNETGWVHVRGSVTDNVLTIEAQDNTCTDTISWMVIGERQDKHMYDTEWTDDNGKVIVEPLKRVDVIDDTNPNEG